MKYCPNCGAAVNDGAAFCPQCGTSVPSPGGGYAPNSSYTPSSGYSAPAGTYAPDPGCGTSAPIAQLSTNRGLLKFILLSLITFGIYGLVVMSKISTDINIIASRYDGKKTMHYCLVVFVFSWLTLGIYPLIWSHKLCGRIGDELCRRGIAYDFGASTFWLWGVLGGLIIVGPFIYCYKLFKAMNLLSADYNQRG